MPTLNPSVLVISKSKAPQWSFEFLQQPTWPMPEALQRLSVVVIDSELLGAVKKNLIQLQQKSPELQWIFCCDQKIKPDQLLTIANDNPFRIADGIKDPELEKFVIEAIEKSQFVRQNLELEKVVEEQKLSLKKLYEDLEDRVNKRQQYLEDTRKKTYLANSRWDAVRRASEAIHQATSVGEMEKLLTEALAEPLQLSLTKILLSPQDETFAKQIKSSTAYSILRTSLKKELSAEHNGSVFFLRQKSHPFGRDENEFLHKITEAISLSLSRILKLEQMESLLEQWQATFNAVSDPVCMINQNYEIVQSNKALTKKAGLSHSQVVQAKCYAVLFGRNQPCTDCHRGKNFRIDTAKAQQTFDVYSQELFIDPLKEKLFVHQYHEMTEQLRLERKILESAKLAELGSIGSSIAHELNNPLGGILSFVQLIKMDLKPDNPIFEDIVEMEKGVLRSRDIIQNLLGFTRKANEEEKSEIDLGEVVEKAVKIIELHTRSRGIELRLSLPKAFAKIDGSPNTLVQAFQNLFQKSLESIQAKTYLQKGFHGVIEARLTQEKDTFVVTILDNGLGSETATGLAIPVATQIIHDHNGEIQIDADTGPFRVAKISFSRPVFKSESPE
jgi:two-component system NtrC family sensor kinase